MANIISTEPSSSSSLGYS